MNNNPKPAVLAINPSKIGLIRIKILFWISKLPLFFLFKRFFFKVEVEGAHHLNGGAKLLLINHHTQIDPLVLSYFINRPLFFFMTEPAMSYSLFSRLMSWLGQIPKKKLIADTACMKAMKGWTEVGAIVATFPEGQFSYDGHLGDIKPGLSQLIHFLDVPVVTARLVNADRSWPAWAALPRRTGLKIEIDPPRKFNKGDKVEEVIEKRLYVNPESCKRYPSFGKKLAKGLDKLLRFCLECGSEHSLKSEKNVLICTICKEQWTVDTSNIIQGKETFTIKQALKRTQEHLETLWKKNIIFRTIADAIIMDASRPQWTTIDSGVLKLSRDCLELGNCKINNKDIVAHTRDWGNLILIRTARARYAIKIPNQEGFVVWSMALDLALNKGENKNE